VPLVRVYGIHPLSPGPPTPKFSTYHWGGWGIWYRPLLISCKGEGLSFDPHGADDSHNHHQSIIARCTALGYMVPGAVDIL